MNILLVLVVSAILHWTSMDGTVRIEKIRLVQSPDGQTDTLTVSREKILARNARRLDIIPEFFKARKV